MAENPMLLSAMDDETLVFTARLAADLLRSEVPDFSPEGAADLLEELAERLGAASGTLEAINNG